MSKILVVSSNTHKNLASKQLENCLSLIKKSHLDYQVEIVEAGTYEIPFVINSYDRKQPFDGYIALGLILKTNIDHYNFIISHIKDCFTHFSLNNIAVGNGIISGSNLEELDIKLDSHDPCLSAYQSAFDAIDYLIKLKNKLTDPRVC